MNLISLKIKSCWPPVLVSLCDETYVMPGWIKVPVETTMEEIRKCWIDVTPPSAKTVPDIVQNVKSSNGKKTYTVTCKNNQWTCNCVGFGFRRKCKHIKTVQDDNQKIN